MKNPQTYQLFIKVHKACDIQVGKLGKFHFPAGDYVYTGSAKKNIEARVRRHLSSEKKLRWHIDYLLQHKNVEIQHYTLSTKSECTLNQQTKGEIIAKGFGASDCRNRCRSHLKAVSSH